MDLRKIIGFVSISGVGFLLDLTVFTALTGASYSIFWSNLVAGICGMTLVYTISWRRIFTPSDDSFIAKLILYIAYGLCLLVLSSELLTRLAALLSIVNAYMPVMLPAPLVRLAAKAFVTVCTLVCNYGFSTFIVERLRLHTQRHS